MDWFSSNLEYAASQVSTGMDIKGTLVISSAEIAFYPTLTHGSELHIPSDTIINFGLTTEDTRSQRITLTRLYFLRWLAFAFPKTTGEVTTTLTVQTDTLQTSFHIDDKSIDEVHQDLVPYLDQWGIILE